MSTVTVVPTVDMANSPPRVRLDVTDVGTSPAITATTVMRTDPDGTSTPVRTLDGNALTLSTSGTNRVGFLYDYEMPYGAGVTYSTVESPTVISAPVTVNELKPWLIHPGIPALSVPFTAGSWGARTTKVQRGVHYPMGRATPVVVTDGTRRAAEYDLTVVTLTDDDAESLETLLAGAAVLLLNVPVSKGWGVTHEYVSVGDVSEERPFRIVTDPSRTWTLPCTVVAAPAGGSQSQRTLADLLSFTSLAALQAKYSTLLALATGP